MRVIKRTSTTRTPSRRVTRSRTTSVARIKDAINPKVATAPKLRNGAIPKKVLKDYVTRYAVVDASNRIYGIFRLEKNALSFVEELGIPLTINTIAMDF